MAHNPKVIVNDIYVPKYATHWHVRFTDPTATALDSLRTTLENLHQANYITYALLTQSIEGDTRTHYHLALGTSKSIKADTLRRRLGILSTTAMKEICYSYYLKPVYNESTPQSNWDYVKNGHDVLFEIGALNKDLANQKINTIPLIF